MLVWVLANLEEMCMSSIGNVVRSFIVQESGLETVEFAVMTAIIVSGVVVALGVLIVTITDLYGRTADLL